MKKFFILALSLMFILSMTVVAFAGVDISGDARLRGIWQSNYNMNDGGSGNNDGDVRNYDERVRLKVIGDVGNGIEVRTRLTSGTDRLDGTGSVTGSTANTSGTIAVDYMYLHIPYQGIVIDAGNMHRSWGNKLLIWDSGRDTLQVTTNLGDTQLGLYTDKVDDSSLTGNANVANAGAENLEDYNNYGIFVNHSAGNLSAGVHVILEDDNRATTDLSGTEISGYVNTSVGAIALAAEVAYKGGDLNEDAQNNNATAGFISVSTDVGAIGVSLTGAIAKNGFAADSHFTPTVFFGSDQPTTGWNFMAADNSTTWALIAGVSTDISSDLSVNGKILYANLENLAGTLCPTTTTGCAAPATASKEDATEIDLGLAYKLTDNATYKVDFGYLMPDNITLTDDNAMALAHKIEVSF